MKKILFALTIFLILATPSTAFADHSYWQIQSIDTMKYSRDLAREKARDAEFEAVIDAQVSRIAKTGATHVAIGTPYDEEFVPYLSKWVSAARKNGLKVWFRGNLSGWEEWFGYPEITESEHLLKLGSFILQNKNLFEDGDIFTPCTECENGGPGDPRQTRKVEEFRNFLIVERETAIRAFEQIGRKVEAGYFSMNGDVARLVMDRPTTEKLGGIVVIDHYVERTEDLARDIQEISELSGGKVVLGEFGAPIPDIHGQMTPSGQDAWINDALSKLSLSPNLIGLNYWVSEGGSTAIWDKDGEKPAVSTITSFFKPRHLSFKVVNAINKPIENAEISFDGKLAFTNKEGVLETEVLPSIGDVTVTKEGYTIQTLQTNAGSTLEVILEMEKESLLFKIRKFFVRLFSGFGK